jgi:hypothetical protein
LEADSSSKLIARGVVRPRVHRLARSLPPSALLHLLQHLDTGEGGKEVQRLSRGLNMLRGGVKHGSAQAMEGQVSFGIIEAETFKPTMQSAKSVLHCHKFDSSNSPIRIG